MAAVRAPPTAGPMMPTTVLTVSIRGSGAGDAVPSHERRNGTEAGSVEENKQHGQQGGNNEQVDGSQDPGNGGQRDGGGRCGAQPTGDGHGPALVPPVHKGPGGKPEQQVGRRFAHGEQAGQGRAAGLLEHQDRQRDRRDGVACPRHGPGDQDVLER